MLRWLFIVAVLGAALFWWLQPASVPPSPELAPVAEAPAPGPPPAAVREVPAPKKSAPVVAKPEGDLSWNDFNELFDQLDACELLTKGVANRVPRTSLWLFLIRRARTPVSDPVIGSGDIAGLFRMLEEKNLEAGLRKATAELDPIQQFFAGAFFAGLSDIRPIKKPDYALASQFFSGAERGHMGNGAVYFFRASAEQLRDPKDFRGFVYLQQALRTRDFDTYLTRMARLIWETGLGDPKLFVLSLSLVNRLPHLLYEPSAHLSLQSVSEKDPGRAQLAQGFGQALMRAGMAGKNLPSGVYWSKDDYDFGRNIARKAWSALNPGIDAAATDSSWPSSGTFGGNGALNPFDSGQFPPRREDGTCDLEGFRRYVAQLAQISFEAHERALVK